MPDFKLLGPTEVLDGDGHSHTPGGPKLRQVLALLALNAGKVVSVDVFVTELWGEVAKKAEIKTLQTHIYHLRQVLAGGIVATQAPGYALRVDPHRVDALVFPRLVDRAAEHQQVGDHRAAELVLRDALAMWTGPALADVRLGPALAPYATALHERRLRAQEMHMDARISLGLHGEVIEELRMLVAAHPLNENFHAQLITALSHTGRRTDARHAYEGLRALLHAELGVGPSFAIPDPHVRSHPGKEIRR
ncbi:AfsR/SARP family transcriptional regulator [Acrocarpospora macrocephala]|uniref:Putative actinorhodin operon activatory protein n=1 Tax=Acrocarpospora macrocephala TaxID=150177 RepID=A0A5M3X1Q1_9ACTN|nr:AfsR/SARP family transcriptional regulator [Acrocarpospora macrocephala]GES15084.1 putative actinorhodin operon activatory protein [Acrocarpospora macrocephala]